MKRFAIETPEQIDRFDQRVQTQISQTAEGCQKCRVEKTPPTARKRGLDAEKPFDQRRDRRQSNRQVQEDRQTEQQEDAEKQMILARPELGLFERLLED